MPELRWTLLILGGVFILGLALWEIRRQRQAPRQSGGGLSAGASSGSDRVAPTMESGAGSGSGVGGTVGGFRGTGSSDAADAGFSAGIRAGGGFADAGRVQREPIITLPELHPADSRPEPRMTARRDPPVVEVDDAAFARLRIAGETGSIDDEVAHAEDTIAMTIDLGADDLGPDAASVAASGSGDPTAHQPSDATAREAGGPTVRGSSDRTGPEAGHFGASSGSPAASETPNLVASASAAGTTPRGVGETSSPSESIGFATDADTGDADTSQSAHQPPPEAHPASADGAPVVDWPREETRKIVALRLVSAPAARFAGRAVRQALAAEGFVLGKFDIFHKAGPDDRAVLSAASLTKPGTFAMNTIDAQRFGGISLFAVLPGPLSPQETFDELLTTARSLNSRLQGALQDERGEPLTPMRCAAIRQSLSEGDGSTDPGDGAGSQSETRQ
jgi:hypothetical protein